MGETGVDVMGETEVDVMGETGVDVMGETGVDVVKDTGIDVNGETSVDIMRHADCLSVGKKGTRHKWRRNGTSNHDEMKGLEVLRFCGSKRSHTYSTQSCGKVKTKGKIEIGKYWEHWHSLKTFGHKLRLLIQCLTIVYSDIRSDNEKLTQNILLPTNLCASY